MERVYKSFIPHSKPPYDPNLRRDGSDWRGKIEIYKDKNTKFTLRRIQE